MDHWIYAGFFATCYGTLIIGLYQAAKDAAALLGGK